MLINIPIIIILVIPSSPLLSRWKYFSRQYKETIVNIVPPIEPSIDFLGLILLNPLLNIFLPIVIPVKYAKLSHTQTIICAVKSHFPPFGRKLINIT